MNIPSGTTTLAWFHQAVATARGPHTLPALSPFQKYRSEDLRERAMHLRGPQKEAIPGVDNALGGDLPMAGALW